MKKTLSLILALMLTFFCIVACTDNSSTGNSGNEAEAPESSPWDSATYKEDTTLGTGSKTFTFQVCAYDKTITFTINSDAETVGEALFALDLIDGENASYGLYVKKVNGIVADYDIDAKYWAFYIYGEYAMNGVDTTPLENGATYKMSRE